MNLPELSHSDIVKTLCVIGDREFLFARRYMENAGFDLRQDGAQARAWCEAQAEAGVPEAQFALAKLCFTGLYGDEDKQKALHWCRKASDAGFPPAKLMLSGFYESGLAGLQPDPQHAFELRKDAANQGDIAAMRTLAADYLLGVFVEKDQAEALRLLRHAAEIGDAYAQCFLGNQLIENADVASIAEGVKWIQAAADQDNPSAHFHLGHFYWNGSYGFPEDKAKSRYHLDLAAKLEEESYAGLI